MTLFPDYSHFISSIKGFLKGILKNARGLVNVIHIIKINVNLTDNIKISDGETLGVTLKPSKSSVNFFSSKTQKIFILEKARSIFFLQKVRDFFILEKFE